MNTLRAILAVALGLFPTSALIALQPADPTAVLSKDTRQMFDAYIANQRADCRQIDNGELRVDMHYLDTSIDFDEDGKVDPMFDTAGLDCSTTTSSFSGGTGGTILSVFLSESRERAAFSALNHMVLHWSGTTVLLVAHHGSACGRSGSHLCHAAYSYSEGSFASINQE